ncbi:shufflon system plasmid conjugative transfer pilus tip adhesin PilV [Ralstonia pseudosolanacearum]|uniref:shufflon system plasmid conjugative transfer pilus tip adhesin PilV n=1 Tax=Ralstonia pseudosolanacearum TaxID=1310165 RepID=UPI001FFA3E6E|nr:shufflon system plasmid conjugative transfer pilus tip adhesin PilV [Ralstonia pseudosolanacearum]
MLKPTHVGTSFTHTRARQRGFYDLVSLGIGASIAIAFAATQLWQQRQEMLSQQMAAQGNVLADIGNSINGKYLSLYYSNLVNGTAIPGVANEYAPTMAELQAINVVPAGYATTSAYGTPYVVSLAKTPSGCVAPNCDINGMVYIAGAITDPSTGAPLTLEDGAAAIGGDGGFSDTITPSAITGLNAQWTQPNPLGNTAGILAMRVGYGSSGWAAYVRRDGSLPMEGDLNFRGTNGTQHNIDNAATVNAQKAVLPAGNSLQIGSAAYYGDGLNAAVRSQPGGGVYAQDVNGNPAPLNSGGITTSGNTYYSNSWAQSTSAGRFHINAGENLYLQPWASGQTIVGGGGGSGQLVVTGRLYGNEYIQPNGWAAEGGGCSPNGLIANSGNGPLFCQSGVWTAAGGGQTWRCVQYDSYWASGILQNHYFSVFNYPFDVSSGSEGSGWVTVCRYS